MVTKRFLFLAAGVLCASAFTASCSSDEDSLLEYGGQKYKTVVINGTELMAENLNYYVPGSKCYNNDPANCAKYGRLYNWLMAMELPSSCDSRSCDSLIRTPHKGICPDGWHIPGNADWDKLYRSADGTFGTKSPYDSRTAGRYLKAKEGWNHCGPSGPSSSSGRSSSSGSSSSSGTGKSYLCEDALGFAALPGGYSNQDVFNEAGEVGFWWRASENEDAANAAYMSFIYHRFDDAHWGDSPKNYFYSVRCFKD